MKISRKQFGKERESKTKKERERGTKKTKETKRRQTQKQRKRKQEGCGKVAFYEKPAIWLLKRLPDSWIYPFYHRIKRLLKEQYSESDKKLEQRAQEFLIKEISVLFAGMMGICLLMAGMMGYQMLCPTNIILNRNAFGGGMKEEKLVLASEEAEAEYTFSFGERELSEAEKKKLYKDLFSKVEENMLGSNLSCSKVNQRLHFDEKISGYPFTLSYEPENLEYIHLDGELGQAANRLKGSNFLQTGITVTAAYASYVKSERYEVTIVPVENNHETDLFEEAKNMLIKLEEKTRNKNQITVPDAYGNVHISREKPYHAALGCLLFAVGILLYVLFSRYSTLKEAARKCKEETLQDFPSIVHLFALYMGAGLSFSSAVKRIAADYQEDIDSRGKRYALDQVVIMNQQMNMGASQKEACVYWGKQFEESVYQKLSVILVQNLSKGTREAKQLMENAEREAFRKHVDAVRRKGEEASTKLLFPMIFLLGTVMLFVMFPAMLRFHGF